MAAENPAARAAPQREAPPIEPLLLLKILLVPALIGGITLAGRRWGPGIAGWLSGFPVVTGPILLFIGIERGPQFAAGAAAGALAGGIAWLGFALGYAWAATRLGWWGALAAGLCAYAAVAMVVVASAPPFAVVALLIVAGIALAPRGFPQPGPVQAQASSPALEIGARMAAGGALTVAVTRVSPQLGPGLSGVLSVFPVMGIVLAAFSHRASGSAFAILLLRGMVFGFYAFSAYCLTVALAVAQAGVAAGFALALGVSLAVHFCVLRYVRARERRARAP